MKYFYAVVFALNVYYSLRGEPVSCFATGFMVQPLLNLWFSGPTFSNRKGG